MIEQPNRVQTMVPGDLLSLCFSKHFSVIKTQNKYKSSANPAKRAIQPVQPDRPKPGEFLKDTLILLSPRA